MRAVFLLALTLIALSPLVDSGRILRAWHRRHGGLVPFRPMPMQRSHYGSPWNYYRVPRNIHHQEPFMNAPRRRNRDELQRFRGHQTERGQQTHQHGFPIQRDPTTHYAPPSEDEISLGSVAGRRSTGGHVRQFRPWRRPPPPGVKHISLWKLLAMQRRRRYGPPPRRPFRPLPPPPRPPRPHGYHSSEEAEVAPILPNFVYFLPKDTMTPREPNNATEKPSADGLKPGFVSDVPLYPTQATSASEFKPVTSRDYLMKVVEIRRPTLLQPASSTASSDSDQRSAPAPTEPLALDSTESLLHELLKEPPSPINSFNINIDPNAEGSDAFIKIGPSSFLNTESLPTSPKPVFTTSTTPPTTTRGSTSKPSPSTTFKPMFAVRVIVPPPNPPTKETAISNETASAEEVIPTKIDSSSSFSISNSKEMKTEGISKAKESNFPRPISSKKDDAAFVISKTALGSSDRFKEASADSKEDILSGVVNSIKAGIDPSKPVIESVKIADQEEEPAVVEEVTVTKAPPKPAPTYKWPTMKPYIRNVKKPIVTTSSKVSSTSTVVKSNSGSSSESTSISITGIRSKVKEYKPVLGTAPGLLLFDKVDSSAELMAKGSVTSSTSSPQKATSETSASTTSSASSISSSTTVSPMQNFDPMKMIHSWLTKAKPKT